MHLDVMLIATIRQQIRIYNVFWRVRHNNKVPDVPAALIKYNTAWPHLL